MCRGVCEVYGFCVLLWVENFWCYLGLSCCDYAMNMGCGWCCVLPIVALWFLHVGFVFTVFVFMFGRVFPISFLFCFMLLLGCWCCASSSLVFLVQFLLCLVESLLVFYEIFPYSRVFRKSGLFAMFVRMKSIWEVSLASVILFSSSLLTTPSTLVS